MVGREGDKRHRVIDFKELLAPRFTGLGKPDLLGQLSGVGVR